MSIADLLGPQTPAPIVGARIHRCEDDDMSKASDIADTIRAAGGKLTRDEIQAAREQQAKEFAECQARVVVLKQLLNSAGVALNAWHIKYGEFQPDWLPPAGQVKLIEEITEALASTDTAAQTLREKWIPVSERLPEPDTYVLYYNGKYTGFGKWVSGEWCESDERWQTDFGEYIELLGPKITYWQPLPEPPKEKK